MAYQLEFERLLSYDVGQSGITLQANLKLKEQSLDISVKVDTGASCPHVLEIVMSTEQDSNLLRS